MKNSFASRLFSNVDTPPYTHKLIKQVLQKVEQLIMLEQEVENFCAQNLT